MVRRMFTSQRAVVPCGLGVKVCVWVAGKTICSHCYTRAISERFRDKGLIMKRCINLSVYFYFKYASENNCNNISNNINKA